MRVTIVLRSRRKSDFLSSVNAKKPSYFYGIFHCFYNIGGIEIGDVDPRMWPNNDWITIACLQTALDFTGY